MKKINAAIFFALMLMGCNGGSGGGHDSSPPPVSDPATPPAEDDNTPPPPATPIGTEQGAAVSKIIGAEGGELDSADGSVTLQVPAGAFGSEITVSIQPVTNEAESLGGIGTAFRIQPEGLQSSVPMTLSFHADTNALQGTALRFVRVGYQDAGGRWRVFENPQRDEGTATVSVQTTHFSVWSMLVGLQLKPASATVKTSASKELQIINCTADAFKSADDPDELLPFAYDCDSAPINAFSAAHWSVNGAEGSSEFGGSVVANTDKSSGEATYTAPPAVPEVNPVAVSVEVTDFDNPNDKTTLVSNITIVPDANCAALKGAESISADVSFDAFSWEGSNENQSYRGRQSGHLIGVMTNQIPAAARDFSPIGIWTSQNAPHEGLVTMNDTHQLFYPDETITETAVGSAAPFTGVEVPSSVTLTVDYASCTYEMAATFVVLGTVTSAGVSAETPIIPGGIYYGEALPADFFLNGIKRDVTLPARYDTAEKLNGYYPAGQSADLRAEGSTTGHWQLDLVP